MTLGSPERAARRHVARGLAAFALAAIALASTAGAASAFVVPTGTAEPTAAGVDNFVLDEAGILDDAVIGRINDLGTALERATPGAEVAVLTVRSLDGRDIADVANERFRSLGVGDAEEDNGVLLIVAPTERDVRIEVGYGLEGAIPDGKAGRILDEFVIPRFRDDDYPGGIEAGYGAIVNAVAAEYDSTIGEEYALDDASSGFDIGTILAIGIFVVVIVAIVWTIKTGGGSNGGKGGGGSSGGGWRPTPSSWRSGSGSSSSGGSSSGGFGGGSSGGGGASRSW